MSINNNQAISDKLKNLINVSPRDYCINSKSKSKHFLITDKFNFNDLLSLVDKDSFVLKYDENHGLNKLYQLNKVSNTFFKETGTWPLFIARYFLNGKTPKGKTVYAPIILKRVKIEKNIGSYSIYSIDDEYVINEKLLTFIEREWDVNLSSIYDKNNLSINDYLQVLQSLLNKRIEIVKENDDLSLIDEETLYISDSFIIGIYEPGGGKLKDDLLNIINEGVDPFVSQKINGESFYKNEELVSEPIFQISNNLNLYQKYAIRSSLIENTVIHGPPGTGKSEVISNIIANIVVNNKSALIVSEKKAALDVVIERIGALKMLSLSLHNDVKNEFFESIINLSNKLGTDWISGKISGPTFSLIDHIKVLDSYVKLKKYKNNIKIFANKFINIKKMNEKLDNNLYDFWNKINHFGLKKFLKLKSNDLIVQLSQTNSDEKHYEDLYKSINFIKENHLTNDNNFSIFMQLIKNIEKTQNDSGFININDYIENIKNSISEINYLFSNLYNKEEIISLLKNDSNYIFKTYVKHKDLIREYERLIDSKFFKILNRENFKDFLIKYNKTSSSNKKFFINEYVENNNIIDKIPLFKKHTNIDDDVMNFLDKLYESNYYFLDQQIIKNIKLFNPVFVEAYFSQQIFQSIINYFNNSISLNTNFDTILFLIKNDISKEEIMEFNDIYNLQKKLGINNLEINGSMFDSLLSSNANFSIDTNKIFDNYLLGLKSKLSSLSDEYKNKVKELFRICYLKKKPTVYKILENYTDVLKILFPIWFTKPESVALFLPLKRNLFNYGIFDEASQMFLEKSYPLVYRVKNSIVAGDDKQLKPSSFFMSVNSDDDIEYDITDTDVAESLLEKAQASLWNTFILKNHYRSQSKELIEFSNEYIYNNELIYATINDDNQDKYGLETINVNGFFNNGINEIEAQKTIELLKQNIDLYKKIVIITFNASQSKYIEKEMMKLSDPKILQKLEQGLLIVTNLENVQGNEGDLVIISVSYAKKDETSKLHANFGPLINDGGSNRLNVAITRAKEKMIVIKSFVAADVPTTSNPNLLLFRNFIAFLDTKKNGIENSHKSTLPNSDFSKFLILLCKKYNCDLKYSKNIGSDCLDFLICDNNKIIFTINFRSYNYYNELIDVSIDVDKNAFFNSRKYNTHLINEWEWVLSNDTTIEYVINLFKKYL